MTRLSAAEYRAAVSEPRQSKYRAKRAYRCASCGAAAERHKCSACGSKDTLSFDSKAEAKRWDRLRQMQAAGLISGLCTQVPLRLEVSGKVIGKYIADFGYQSGGGLAVYEDVKGCDTPLSAWKRKHAEAQYGIRIEVIR
jgi:hypothetical protein